MTADEDYGFDVAGFIHVPGALSAAETAACNETLDAAGRDGGRLEWPLPEHPALNSYVETLCGPDFAIDKPPALVPDSPEGTAGVRLRACAPDDRRRLRYSNNGDTRECKGVRIFLALAPAPEDGGIVLVPASHNRSTEPPDGFLDGADDLDMTEEPVLEAGDLLICAATTLHGVRGRPGRVIEIVYIGSRARPAAGYPEIEAPEWVTELTPEQQAVVGTMTTGRGGTVISDGRTKLGGDGWKSSRHR